MNVTTEINREARWSIALSVLMIVAGMLAIIMPLALGMVITISVGVLLMFGGAAHLAFAWHIRHYSGLWWELLLGFLYAAVGVLVLLYPKAALASLTLMLAAFLFVESVLEFVLAYYLRPLKGSGWLVFDGIITLVLAILISITWPWNTSWVIGTIVGISIIFSGIARLVLSLAVRSMTKVLP